MAKLSIKPGSENVSLLLFIQDSASTVGGGKTGITYDTASLTCYYVRPGSTAAAISLVTQTVTGAWSSGGFVEIDSTNMPGVYRFDVPNAVLAAGVRSAVAMLKGASGMAPVTLEIDLNAEVNLVSILGTVLTETAGQIAAAFVKFFNKAVPTGTVNSLPDAVAGAANGVAIVGSVMGKSPATLAVADVSGNLPVDLQTIKTQTVTASAGVTFPASIGTSTYAGGAVASVTNPVTAGTVSDKTGYALTSAYDAAKTAATQTSVDDLPTNSELATALGTADDATLAAIAALNNLSSAQAQSAATAALTAYDPPTNAEMEARTLVAASYFDPASDVVAHVTLVDTTTTNTDMVAAAPTAAANADAVWDELLAAHSGAGSAGLALATASSGGDPSVLADAVWDEALSGHVGVGSAGAGLAAAGSAGDPWSTTLPGAYTGNQAGAILDAIRDVTAAIDVSAVTVTASNDAGVLTVVQAVTFGATVSGLTISATWAKLYWTLKESIYDDDDQAILQLVESNPGAGTDGLLYLDSAAIVLPITVADGTLTVNQAGGTVAIVVSDNATTLLAAASDLVWDIKTKDAAGATVQNTTGTASIVRAVTQTI